MFYKTLNAFVFSNLFISLVAVAMVYRTDCLWQLNLNYSVYSLIFFSTLFIYSIHSLASTNNEHVNREIWNQTHKQVHYFFSGLSLLGIVFFMLNNHDLFLLLFPVILMTAYYTFPRLNLPILKQRTIYFKTITLAFVWLYATSVLPLLISGEEICTPRLISFVVLEFSFLYLICFFFEHRDRNTDPQKYFLINPHRYPFAVVFTCAFLFYSAITFASFYQVSHIYLILKGMLMLFLILTCRKSITTTSDIWFYMILDGLMGADAFIFLIQKFL